MWLAVSIALTTGASASELFTQNFDPSTQRLQLAPSARYGLFRQSDAIAVSVTGGATLRVFNLDGATVYQGAATSLHLVPGHYFVETDGDRAQFAVLPDDYAGATFLGTEGYGDDSNITNNERIDAIQPAWVRLLSGVNYWWRVEPQRDVWNWSDLDKAVDNNFSKGRKIILVAWSRPDWLTQDTEFIARYVLYVQKLAERYRGKVYAIEVWNEPDINPLVSWEMTLPYTSSKSDVAGIYRQLLQAARSAVKQVAPEIRVVGAGWATPGYQEIVDGFLAGNGASLFDAYTFHDYDRTYWGLDQDITLASGAMLRLDRLIEQYRARMPGLPLWMDEGGLYGQSALEISNSQTDGTGKYVSLVDWHRGMTRAIKYVVMARAAGVELLLPHLLPRSTTDAANNYDLYGFEYGDRGPHPKTSAFLMACHWLNGAQFAQSRTPNEDLLLYAWRRADGAAVVFAWTREGHTVSVNTSALPAATDIFGTPVTVSAIGDEPILFHANHVEPATLLGQVRSALAGSQGSAPTIDAVPTQSVGAGEAVRFTVNATDVDGDNFSITVAGLPPGATFNPLTGEFSWSGATVAGNWTVVFTATDDWGTTRMFTVPITVVDGEQDGLAAQWPLDEEAGVIATDVVGSNDGTLVNFSATGWSRTDGERGLRFDGTDDYIRLDSSRIDLTNNFSIVTRFRATAAQADGTLLSIRFAYPSSGLRVILSRNTLWVQGQTTAGWKSASFCAGTIQNDQWHDLALVYDQGRLTIYLDGAEQGSASWSASLVMDSAAATKLGTDSAYYFAGLLRDLRVYQRPLSAAQVQGLSSEAGLAEVVTPANQTPQLGALSPHSVAVGQTCSFSVSATDADGDSLAYSAAALPAGASFNASTRTFTWAPSGTQTGTHTVTFAASDGTASDSAQVTITVTQPNRVPVLAGIGGKSVNEGQSLSFTLSATDADGNALTYSASGLPAGASFNTSTRTFAWTPGYTQAGMYSVAFAVTDGALSDSETITIAVYNINRAPVLAATGTRTVILGQTLSFTITASDPDGDALVYSVGKLPSGASFNAASRTFTWRPARRQAGIHSITFTVSDGKLSDTETGKIEIRKQPAAKRRAVTATKRLRSH
jgi:PKD repeat protein